MTQYNELRKYTDLEEGVSRQAVQCPACHVCAVPRGISSTMHKGDVEGELHCPNCGHVYGRDSLVVDESARVGIEVKFTVENANEEPVEGAIVQLEEFSKLTDEDGKVIFVVTASDENGYKYIVTHDNYVPEIDTLDASQAVDEKLSLVAGNTVTFTVTDGTDPVVGAIISFGLNSHPVKITGEDGKAVFRAKDGSYGWLVDAKGFKSQASQADVTVSGSAKTVNVVLVAEEAE